MRDPNFCLEKTSDDFTQEHLLDRIVGFPVSSASDTSDRFAERKTVIALLNGFDPFGNPLVISDGCSPGEPKVALTSVSVVPSDVNKRVVLLVAASTTDPPIIIGVVRPVHKSEPKSSEEATLVSRPGVSVKLEGEQIVISAEKEIVLRCGEASITLTKSGKVITRGAYLLDRSSGAIRIQGGSVEIN